MFYGNSVAVWLLAAGVAMATFAGLYSVRGLVARRLRSALAGRDEPGVIHATLGTVGETWLPIILVAALYAGSYFLMLPAALRSLMATVIVIALLIQGAIWGSHVVRNLVALVTRRRTTQDPAQATAFNIVNVVARAAIWSLAVLLILDNLGINITALVAGLGIGGIAVALAAQNVLGDLFSSLSILLDKPFVVGDFMIFGEHAGTVEKIGLKTTRIRSLSGEQIICSNSDLLNTRIRNYKRMAERRSLFTIGIVYGTPYDKVEMVPRMIREIIEAQPQARFDRAHFKSYGDFSLDFETVYFVRLPEYNLFMDVQQAINLALYRRFEEEGIEFAFPTQTIHLDPGEGPVTGSGA